MSHLLTVTEAWKQVKKQIDDIEIQGNDSLDILIVWIKFDQIIGVIDDVSTEE